MAVKFVFDYGRKAHYETRNLHCILGFLLILYEHRKTTPHIGFVLQSSSELNKYPLFCIHYKNKQKHFA